MVEPESDQLAQKTSVLTKAFAAARAGGVGGLLPDATPQMVKSILQEFPDFTAFGRGAIKSIEHLHERTLEAGDEAQADFETESDELKAQLYAELAREGLSEDYRRFILEQLMEVGRQRAESHRARLEFRQKVQRNSVMAVAATVAAGAAIVVAQVLAHAGDDDESGKAAP